MSTTEHFYPSASSQTHDTKSSSYDYEMAVLLFSSGNFSKSISYFKKSMENFRKEKNFPYYFSCYFLMIQVLNELGEQQDLKQLQKEVDEVCQTHKLLKTARVLACSAYYSVYIEKNMDKAKQELKTALKRAFDEYDECLKADNRLKQNSSRFDIMICLYVFSIYYYETEDYKNCLQELKNLKILLKDYEQLKQNLEWDHTQTDNIQELAKYQNTLQALKENQPNVQGMKLGINFLTALIEIKYIKNYKQAEKLLWDVYEEANKTNNVYFVPYVLFSMSRCHVLLKNKKQAYMFFNLAKKNVNKDRKLLINYMENLKQFANFDQIEDSENYDIIFDMKDHLIVEREKGCVELKNQFVLMDLLKLFLLNPGVPYSKESIIQKVWKQEYSPSVHDNKIYVTIKRLREMVEVESCKPFYICRNNAGYYFSTQAKVLVRQ